MFDPRALRARPVSYLITTPRVLTYIAQVLSYWCKTEGGERSRGGEGRCSHRARQSSFPHQAHSGLLKKEYSSVHGLSGGSGGVALTFYEFENRVTNVTQDLFYSQFPPL